MRLTLPITEKQTRQLKLGDFVFLNGIIYTARDAAHKYLIEENPQKFKNKLKNTAIYHCGPIVRKKANSYEIISAGPTTSIREEPYEWKIIKNYKIRAIIGKGGMGDKTTEACKRYGCVYLSAIGGAAAVLAKSIVKVVNVYKLEFGVPEAIWEIEVKDFPAIVTIDAKGNSIHKNIYRISKKNSVILSRRK